MRVVRKPTKRERMNGCVGDTHRWRIPKIGSNVIDCLDCGIKFEFSDPLTQKTLLDIFGPYLHQIGMSQVDDVVH